MRKGQRSKISPGIVQMKLHPTLRNPEKLSNVLHRLAVGDTGQTLPFALSQQAPSLTVRGRASDPGGAHMRMKNETHPFQHVVRGLDEAIEAKASVVHRQRERREPVLACGNANRQAGPDLEAERIVK